MHSVRRLFFLIALAFYTVSSIADQFESFSINGKYGIKNTSSGTVVLEAIYQSVGWSNGEFIIVNNLIGAQQNEKWALFKLDGTKITDHLFAALLPFTDDLFISGKRAKGTILLEYGIVNSRGKTILPFDFSNLENKGNVLIATKRLASIYRKGLLSQNGKELIPITFREVKEIEGGLFAVRDKSGLSALYNSSGDALSAFLYESITALNNDVLQVKSFNKIGLISKMGETIVAPIYKVIEFSGDKTRALPFKKWDYYSSGIFQSSFHFDLLRFSGDNIFAVNNGNNTGLIDVDEKFLFFKDGLKLKSTQHQLSVVEDLNGLQGVIDNTGKTILPVFYDSLRITEHLLFAQTINDETQYWNVFNLKGKKQSLYEYNEIHEAEYGVLKALRNNKYGFLNEVTGREVSPFLYDEISAIEQGLAMVEYQNSRGVINTSGNWIITPYSDSLSIQNNRILSHQGSEFKLFDLKGGLIASSYKRINPLPQGYSQSLEDGLVLYNDQQVQLLEPAYESIEVLSNDLYLLSRDSLSFLYKPSSQSDFKLSEDIQALGGYDSGYIPVKIDGQWGFLNESGQLRIANRYEAAGEFSEDLFSVKVIGKWAFVDIDENFVIQPIYDEVSIFKDGLAVVKNEKGYGLIDKSGKEILSFGYTNIMRQKDYLLLEKNGRYGIADLKGTLIKDPQFEKITQLAKGFFQIENSGLKGVINAKGEDIVPVVYEKIIQQGDKFIASESMRWIEIEIK
ncbi:WG repeat-containing protein [Roseivirga sp.]|uniref:WG repeat-containing protein n=1 Tax=Roseivirga sp. TaxID=1964215 RepID=UPI003B8C924D